MVEIAPHVKKKKKQNKNKNKQKQTEKNNNQTYNLPFKLNGTVSVSLERKASPGNSLLPSGPSHEEEGEDDESAEENSQQRKGDSGQVFLDCLHWQLITFIENEAQGPASIHSTDLKRR